MEVDNSTMVQVYLPGEFNTWVDTLVNVSRAKGKKTSKAKEILRLAIIGFNKEKEK
jgi:hypothetical protein